MDRSKTRWRRKDHNPESTRTERNMRDGKRQRVKQKVKDVVGDLRKRLKRHEKQAPPINVVPTTIAPISDPQALEISTAGALTSETTRVEIPRTESSILELPTMRFPVLEMPTIEPPFPVLVAPSTAPQAPEVPAAVSLVPEAPVAVPPSLEASTARPTSTSVPEADVATNTIQVITVATPKQAPATTHANPSQAVPSEITETLATNQKAAAAETATTKVTALTASTAPISPTPTPAATSVTITTTTTTTTKLQTAPTQLSPTTSSGSSPDREQSSIPRHSPPYSPIPQDFVEKQLRLLAQKGKKSYSAHQRMTGRYGTYAESQSVHNSYHRSSTYPRHQDQASEMRSLPPLQPSRHSSGSNNYLALHREAKEFQGEVERRVEERIVRNSIIGAVDDYMMAKIQRDNTMEDEYHVRKKKDSV